MGIERLNQTVVVPDRFYESGKGVKLTSSFSTFGLEGGTYSQAASEASEHGDRCRRNRTRALPSHPSHLRSGCICELT